MNKLKTVKIYTKKCAFNYCDIRLFAYFKVFKNKCALYSATGEEWQLWIISLLLIVS